MWKGYKSMTVFARRQIRNCNNELYLWYFNYTECTHEREDFAEFARLAFQSGEKKRGLFRCSSDMLIDISFEKEFLLENVRFIGGSG